VEDLGQRFRCLLGHMMSTGDTRGQNVVCPTTPYRDRVLVESLHVVVLRPDEQERAGDPIAGRRIGLVRGAIDAEAGPKRSCPRSVISDAQSPAIARFEYVLWSATVGGLDDPP